MTALLVYVDDIVVTGNDIAEQVILKQNLAKEFEIKELGVLKYSWALRLHTQKMVYSCHKESILWTYRNEASRRKRI